MKTIKKLLEEIESDNTPSRLITKFQILENEINFLLLKIKNSTTLALANEHFDILQKAQAIISKLIFTKEIEVPNSIWKFFKDFDRIDDSRVREFIFQELKNEKYSLNNENFLWYE